MLSGGFKGRAAVVSPRLVPGRCAATNLRTNVAVAVVARRPHIEGPVTLDSFVCPASRLDVVAPRFDAKASFNEAFTSIDGSGRMAISTMTAGANGLAAFAGDLTYKGSLTDVRGRVKLSAQRSRMGDHLRRADAAQRRLPARHARRAHSRMVGDFAADSATLDP